MPIILWIVFGILVLSTLFTTYLRLLIQKPIKGGSNITWFIAYILANILLNAINFVIVYGGWKLFCYLVNAASK